MYKLIASNKVFCLVQGYLEKSPIGYDARFMMLNQARSFSSPASHITLSTLALSVWYLFTITIVAASAAFFFIV